jgi:hypothetical protein
MASSLPPYTRIPLNNRTLDIDAITLRLRHFLIDSVAFLYEVDHEDIKKALSNTDLVATDNLKLGNNTRPSILSKNERDDILYLAALVREASDKAEIDHGGITFQEKQVIYNHVFVPAYKLQVSKPYVFHLLRLYAVHKGIRHREASHCKLGGIPWLASCRRRYDCYAKRVSSDERLVQTLTKNGQMRLRFLLESAITRFSEENKLSYRALKRDGYYVDSASQAITSVIAKDFVRHTRGSKPTTVNRPDLGSAEQKAIAEEKVIVRRMSI